VRVIRKQAFQGHAIPLTAHRPNGPFSSEVLAEPVITYDDTDPDDFYPPGATAQNQYRGLKTYVCNNCSEHVLEDSLSGHACVGEHGES